MKTSQKIIDYIGKNGRVSGKELVNHLGDITSRAVRKQLKNLLENGTLKKIGHPPKVFYLINPPLINQANTIKKDALIINPRQRQTIEERYLYITPTGQIKLGWVAFIVWCYKTSQDPKKTAVEYFNTLKKYDSLRTNGLIDGMKKMKNTFKQIFLDRLFYLDFYSIERFGKTKLGQMLLYAKQSQDKKLIRGLIEEIRPNIMKIIKKHHIDGVLFVPPTVKRETQFMRELEKILQLSIQSLSVTKVKTQVTVPQKTLSKLEDRIENARKTIVVEEIKTYENILLIDDAVGSGATINETAAQIYNKRLCRGQIIGLAITGSFKGFDVISEI